MVFQVIIVSMLMNTPKIRFWPFLTTFLICRNQKTFFAFLTTTFPLRQLFNVSTAIVFPIRTLNSSDYPDIDLLLKIN